MLARFGLSSIKDLQNLKTHSQINGLTMNERPFKCFDPDISPYFYEKSGFFIPSPRKSTAYEPQISLDYVDLCEL